MKWLYLCLSILVIVAALLTIDQVWFDYIDTKTYWKILITEGIIIGLILVIYLLRNEFIEEKKLKKDKFVD